jgi:HEAT repeat protein
MGRQKGKELLREAVKRLDVRLWHQLEEVWRQAEEGIHDAQRPKDGHQQGTPHCRAVEENLTALIPDEWKGTRFTTIDLFALSAAAALHDVGKAGDSPDDHGHVSMWKVRGRAETFGLDQGQAEIVGWIVRAHNDGDLEALPAEPIPLGVAEVALRPLAALFKLADALHTDYRRVSRQVVESQGQRPEDNPKTRFRLRVRGWRFDSQGRIELYAVPTDWDDETTISTGFEMTRRELEPVVPTLKDAGFPWELTLRLDEADLEHKAKEGLEAERRVERAFVGMEYFIETDAPRFKGRDGNIQALWQRVMADPVTLLIGDSGIGKTSLIQAGLFPRLHLARWHTVYTRPFDEPDRFVVHDLCHSLPELGGELPTNLTIVDALAQACKAVENRRLLVVVDQFEDVMRAPVPEMIDGLRQAIVAVQAKRFRNLRLLVSYRADAEASVGPFLQEVSSSARGLPRVYLGPLSRTAAQAALDAGFAEAQVAIDDLLLTAMTDDLERQTLTPGVYPPYVQMVGETLCRAAHEGNESIVTEELYRAQGGCAGIIGHYLLERLAEFGKEKEAARQVLVALVRSTGVKRQRSLEELEVETGRGEELLRPLLAKLVDRRMIRHLGGGEYEIIHDHLAHLVDQEIIGAGERELKELREFMDLRGRAYRRHPALLQTPDMARLYATREKISPNDDQMRLLLHSSLAEQGPAWYWLKDALRAKIILWLRDALTCPIVNIHRVAASTLVEVAGSEAIPDLRGLLKDRDGQIRRAATEALVKVAGPDSIPDLREMLKDESEEVRRAAVGALARVAGPDAIPDLREMLKDESELIRSAAVHALAKVAGPNAIPDLREMLNDESEWGRQAAVGALAKVAGPDAVPALREMLKDESEKVRQEAVEALAKVAGPDAIADLREMLNDESEWVRFAAVEALAEVAGSDAIPDLHEMLKDESGGVRRATVGALAKVGGLDAIPDLRELLKDESKDARQAAMAALAKVAGPDAILDLREMLKDESWGIRYVAMNNLAKVAGPDAVADLRQLLKDESERVREAAVEALAQVAGPDAIPDLREMLKDESGEVRRAAMGALAKAAGPDAIPDLREMLKGKDGGMRQATEEALAAFMTEDDLGWLTDWVIRYPLSGTSEAANRLLIRLDRKLHCPFEIEI